MKKETDIKINENIIQKSEEEIFNFDLLNEDEEHNLFLFGSKDCLFESLFYN
jgi:hypothetical protein